MMPKITWIHKTHKTSSLHTTPLPLVVNTQPLSIPAPQISQAWFSKATKEEDEMGP